MSSTWPWKTRPRFLTLTRTCMSGSKAFSWYGRASNSSSESDGFSSTKLVRWRPPFGSSTDGWVGRFVIRPATAACRSSSHGTDSG
eukprot:8870889-Lingulodinium_polyedra.AAC.1